MKASCEHNNETVGVFEGVILQRPNPNFFECADAISSELQRLSVTFCDSHGRACRIKRDLLKDDEAAQSGGFFNLYTFEIKPSHQKQDLGLRMVHEILALLKNHWTLAVAIPCVLSERFRKWNEGEQSKFQSHERDPSEQEVVALKQSLSSYSDTFAALDLSRLARNLVLQIHFS